MKKSKFTPDYIISIIPNQYRSEIDENSIIISTDNSFNSIQINMINDIEICDHTIKFTIKINKLYNIITIWKNVTHIHNIIFKISKSIRHDN